MNEEDLSPGRARSGIGCAGIALALFFLILMPLILFDVMTTALAKLHLSPGLAIFTVLCIFLGGLINVPVHHIERESVQMVEPLAVFGFWGWVPRYRRVRQYTTIAVNVGGCVIPVLLATWQIGHVVLVGGWPVLALVLVMAANVAVCYGVATPVHGVGITMPGFVSPVTSVGLAWLLLWAPEYDAVRAPVAFTAGVIGPLIGADLFHLKDLTKVSVGILSIGGAGTFDGIVLSGILAALLT